MNFQLAIWRQIHPQQPGTLVTYEIQNISPDLSFLEMLDVLNEQLAVSDGIHSSAASNGHREPIQFDSDCREGICGTCSLVINGVPHGAACQLYLREFADNSKITIEPFRAKAFPIIQDLVVDRSPLDRIIAAGGYVSINTGSAPEANSLPIAKTAADLALDLATCIGCGACVAICPNSSAAFFTGAKVAQYTHLPQGQPERSMRVQNMVAQMDQEGFGNCSNHGHCAAHCPQSIPLKAIATLRQEYLGAWRK